MQLGNITATTGNMSRPVMDSFPVPPPFAFPCFAFSTMFDSLECDSFKSK
jgi:hypothetical protein